MWVLLLGCRPMAHCEALLEAEELQPGLLMLLQWHQLRPKKQLWHLRRRRQQETKQLLLPLLARRRQVLCSGMLQSGERQSALAAAWVVPQPAAVATAPSDASPRQPLPRSLGRPAAAPLVRLALHLRAHTQCQQESEPAHCHRSRRARANRPAPAHWLQQRRRRPQRQQRQALLLRK